VRKWFVSDTGLKVVALVLATITWIFVKAVTSDSRTVEGVQLEIRVKPGLTVSQVSAKTVNVTVRGTTEDLRLASRNELFAVLDLTHEDANIEIQTALKPEIVRHPRRVQVVAVEPTNVTVRLEKALD
jgi:YbbR domain-containing protein